MQLVCTTQGARERPPTAVLPLLAISREHHIRLEQLICSGNASGETSKTKHSALRGSTTLSTSPRDETTSQGYSTHSHPAPCPTSAGSGYRKSASSSRNSIHFFKNFEPLQHLKSACVTHSSPGCILQCHHPRASTSLCTVGLGPVRRREEMRWRHHLAAASQGVFCATT